ncbi:butyrate kinase [Anaeroselena agilis]|uniref:Probable butyrate kinase n=1 Tax=Anaeroselena agilis TaxID=3063788 RepID=A0ABU3NZX3_9FIRM|nr:butyrate kinase [Selenomonadales bacterium 4137-cl]
MERILAINPGNTSTKVAVFDGEKPLFKKTIEHHGEELKGFGRVFDQKEYRLNLILKTLAEAGIAPESLSAAVGRGGLMKPLTSGTYGVNAQMVDDLEHRPAGEHASNLGAALALDIAKKTGVPAFIVDPVSVDEMEEVARISGLPELPRLSLVHALNHKAVARKVAAEKGRRYEELNMVVAHLGSGISVAAHRKGRMIDVSNGKDEGAFSPDRSGGLPASPLMKLCFSGKVTARELAARMMGSGGMYAYLGTRDVREAEKMAAEGNAQAGLVLDAMAYQVAKEIGALATVMAGEVDYVVLTGGIAHSRRITDDVAARVRHIAPVVVFPGEEEMESLMLGALRVLRGEEKAKIYN